jgi:hypothetical protein
MKVFICSGCPQMAYPQMAYPQMAYPHMVYPHMVYPHPVKMVTVDDSSFSSFFLSRGVFPGWLVKNGWSSIINGSPPRC